MLLRERSDEQPRARLVVCGFVVSANYIASENVRKSFFHMCAVTVGTDVYSCEVRIHLPDTVGSREQHSQLYTDKVDFHMYLRPVHAAAI